MPSNAMKQRLVDYRSLCEQEFQPDRESRELGPHGNQRLGRPSSDSLCVGGAKQ